MVKEIIGKTLTSERPLMDFNVLSSMISGAKFFLFDNDSSNFGERFIMKKFSKYTIASLGDYQNTFILDQSTSHGDKLLRVGFCIDFDSNIMSNLKRIFFDDFKDENLFNLLLYVKEQKMQVSCTPYLLECSSNRHKMDMDSVFKTLLAFSAYCSIPIERFNYANITSYSYTSGDYIEADIRYNEMVKLKNNPEEFQQYHAIYSLLLKAFYIKFSNKKSSKNKLILLLDFVNYELACYLENELLLCYWLLINNQRTHDFFKSVQPNTKNIINKISGMAWDLFHLRSIEMQIAKRNTGEDRSFLHSLATEDTGLNDILKINPIKRMAVYNGTSIVLHEFNIFESCDDLDVYEILYPLIKEREQNITTVNFQRLSKKLENELNLLLTK